MLILSLFVCTAIIDFIAAQDGVTMGDYGVDVSYPIHHGIDKNSYFGKRYHDYMEGCYRWSGKASCDATERARLEMNRDQPRLQHNYSDIGFKKMKAPPEVWNPLIKFYNENKGIYCTLY